MTAIDQRWVWFAAGLVAGWLLNWLLMRSWRTRRVEVTPGRPVPIAPVSPAMESDAPPRGPAVSHARLIDVSPARAAGFNMKHADDLTIIEGIGPKTDELLRANGIDGFVHVAQLHVDDLLDILERGGPSFRLANPASWAQQALLASENRWNELKQLQREMVGDRPSENDR